MRLLLFLFSVVIDQYLHTAVKYKCKARGHLGFLSLWCHPLHVSPTQWEGLTANCQVKPLRSRKLWWLHSLYKWLAAVPGPKSTYKWILLKACLGCRGIVHNVGQRNVWDLLWGDGQDLESPRRYTCGFVYVRVFPEANDREGETYPECGQHHPMAENLDWIKRRKWVELPCLGLSVHDGLKGGRLCSVHSFMVSETWRLGIIHFSLLSDWGCSVRSHLTLQLSQLDLLLPKPFSLWWTISSNCEPK